MVKNEAGLLEAAIVRESACIYRLSKTGASHIVYQIRSNKYLPSISWGAINKIISVVAVLLSSSTKIGNNNPPVRWGETSARQVWSMYNYVKRLVVRHRSPGLNFRVSSDSLPHTFAPLATTHLRFTDLYSLFVIPTKEFLDCCWKSPSSSPIVGTERVKRPWTKHS